jgi:hypothetical protein
MNERGATQSSADNLPPQPRSVVGRELRAQHYSESVSGFLPVSELPAHLCQSQLDKVDRLIGLKSSVLLMETNLHGV